VTTGVSDRFAAARTVADAVLYEGYVLYPYRASSRKNQVRWQFGVLTPPAYSAKDRSERSSMHTECIIDPGARPELGVRIRCLHVQHRGIEAASSAGDAALFSPVESLVVGLDTYVDWDEAVDQVVDLPTLDLSALGQSNLGQSNLGRTRAGQFSHEEIFTFAGYAEDELIYTSEGVVAGRIVRSRQTVHGRVVVVATRPNNDARFVKVAVTVENTNDVVSPGTRRDEVMGSSLVAVHTMLAIDDGKFVSLLDPPEEATAAVAGCSNEGTFPVLIAGKDLVLSSPIILYDYPQVAPESPGDLYDSTEIDEILALRVLTLTDEEKSEARGTDPRAAAIIDRCDAMAPEMWESLHGTMRSLSSWPDAERSKDPWELDADAAQDPHEIPWWDPEADSSVDPWSDSLVVAGVEICKGAAVRLAPSHRADAQDLFLRGLTATVSGVFKDVDGNEHVAVTVDDDPATEELTWQGRYLFFHPDEIEPLESRVSQLHGQLDVHGQLNGQDGEW
jgi:hypothetical protein